MQQQEDNNTSEPLLDDNALLREADEFLKSIIIEEKEVSTPVKEKNILLNDKEENNQFEAIDSVIYSILKKYKTPIKNNNEEQFNFFSPSIVEILRVDISPIAKNNLFFRKEENSSKNKVNTKDATPTKESTFNPAIIALSQYETPPRKIKENSGLEKKKITTPIPFHFEVEKRANKERKSTMKVKEQISQNLSEYTFHPHISESSAMITLKNKFDDESFIERAKRWYEKRKEVQEKSRQEKESFATQGCTFKPNINTPPSYIENDNTFGSVHQKLFCQSFALAEKKIEKGVKAKEEELSKSCTFKPSILKTPVKSKYLEYLLEENDSPLSIEDANKKECTFHPITNEPKVKNKNSVLYLQENAFLRLSKIRSPPGKPSEKTLNLMSSASPRESNPKTSRSFQRSKSAGKIQRTVNGDKSEDVRKRFNEFMERQNNTLRDKEKKLEIIRNTMDGDFKPIINKKSNILVNLDFEERCQVFEKKKEESKKQAQEENERECTFRPKINKSSQFLPKRSGEEMFKDYDSLRRKIEARLKEHEEKQLDGATFKPQFATKNKDAQSHLKILTEPQSYLQRIKQQQELQQQKAKAIIMEKEKKEMENCTFRPLTNPAPEYVKRIAQSMAITRGKIDNKINEAKPQWR
ncbi:hypothetical protein ABK040_010831 [Willaertia magna]